MYLTILTFIRLGRGTSPKYIIDPVNAKFALLLYYVLNNYVNVDRRIQIAMK